MQLSRKVVGLDNIFISKIETRGSKEPVSLTLVYVNIKQRKQMDS